MSPLPLKQDLTSAWNLDPEKPTHHGASLFSTGTAAGGSGFADTLFGANAAASSTAAPTSFLGSAAEDSAFTSPSAAPAPPDEPVVLDGDGRPMKPMTESEKALFASGLHQLEAPRHKRGHWRKRLLRGAILAVFIMTLGYGVAAVVPGETRENWKTKVIEWLEPGMVIVEYLPFDLPGQERAEGSEGAIHRRAFQGLDQVKGEMNSYLEQSNENLGIDPED